MKLIVAASAALFGIAVQARAADAPMPIVAAENFYGEVAAAIGGDHVAVTSILINPDIDPHDFEATPVGGPRDRRRQDRHLQRRRLRPVDGQAARRKSGGRPHGHRRRRSDRPEGRRQSASLVRPGDHAGARRGARRGACPRSIRPTPRYDRAPRRLHRVARRRSARRSPRSRAATPGRRSPPPSRSSATWRRRSASKMRNQAFQLAVMNETEPSRATSRQSRSDLKNARGQGLLLQPPGHRPG